MAENVAPGISIWSPEFAKLNKSEQEVLLLVLQGCSNKDIAKERGTRVGTAKDQVKKILNKLDVSTRAEAFNKVMGPIEFAPPPDIPETRESERIPPEKREAFLKEVLALYAKYKNKKQ